MTVADGRSNGPGHLGGPPAVLVLEDGTVYRGTGFGAAGTAFGEAVFTTGMSGYQETLTDPSYRRQVVIATAPQIGNTGWVASAEQDDDESSRIWVSGFVVRDLAVRPSNWRASTSLPAEMARQGVVGVAGIDTRALTRRLRTAGAMRCGVFTEVSIEEVADPSGLVAQVRAIPTMMGADLAGEVTTAEAYVVPAQGEHRFTVAALDLGIKANTPRMLSARGITTHVLPADATLEDITAIGADGVFLSNGPGDPATADASVALTEQVLEAGIPFFGICFGNQILGRALGFGTYKLKFGHRGINQPVKDHTTGRVLVTAQNHGFAVDAPLGVTVQTPHGRARVAFTCLNDDVVEGLECLDRPAFSVQFHPEAAAGPHDASYLFDRFVDLMAGSRSSGSGPGAGVEAQRPTTEVSSNGEVH